MEYFLIETKKIILNYVDYLFLKFYLMNLFPKQQENFINLNVKNVDRQNFIIPLNILIDPVMLNLYFKLRIPYFRGKGKLYLLLDIFY